MMNGEAVANGHSQADILRFVRALSCLEERIECFIDGPRKQPNGAEAVQNLAEDMRVAAPCGEFPSFSEKRGCLVLQIAQTTEVHHDPCAHGCSLSEVLRRLRERVQELPRAPPVPQRLDSIVETHPLSCPPMPLRRFLWVPRMLPVVGEQRRALAELIGLQLLHRASDGSMDTGPSLHQLQAVSDFLGERVLEGVLGLGIERLLVKELGVCERME